MDFNFRESFESYSNVELLKIIDQADKYQPEAVEAARNVLAGREVHDSDYEVMNNYKTTVAANGEGDKKEELYDYLEAIVKADEDTKVARWVKIMVIILGFRYILMLLYFAASPSTHLRDATDFPASLLFLVPLFLPYIYIPFFGILLYKRKRWGWIGLMADNVMGLTVITIGAMRYLYYEPEMELYLWYLLGLLMPILTIGLFIFFLWKKRVTAYFNIGPRVRVNTVTIGICLGMGKVVASELLNYIAATLAGSH